METSRRPGPIIAIHAFAAVGVLFWTSMTVQAFVAGDSNAAMVLLLALVLGGAHVAISVFTARHDHKALIAMWFILVGDTLLTVFVNWKAIALVLFTIGLLLLARTSSARAWYTTR